MLTKILGTFLIYGGLLLTGNLIIGILFTLLFGDSNKKFLELPFNLLFAWLAGYYGVKSIPQTDKIRKMFGTPFWQGLEITLFSHLIGVILVYMFTKEFSLGQGMLVTILGGFGGKRAINSSEKNNVK